MRSLSVVAVQSTNIPPKETVSYAKQTQTLESGAMTGVDAMMASRYDVTKIILITYRI